MTLRVSMYQWVKDIKVGDKFFEKVTTVQDNIALTDFGGSNKKKYLAEMSCDGTYVGEDFFVSMAMYLETDIMIVRSERDSTLFCVNNKYPVKKIIKDLSPVCECVTNKIYLLYMRIIKHYISLVPTYEEEKENVDKNDEEDEAFLKMREEENDPMQRCQKENKQENNEDDKNDDEDEIIFIEEHITSTHNVTAKDKEDDAYSKKKNGVNDTAQRLPKEKKGDTNNNEKSPEKENEQKIKKIVMTRRMRRIMKKMPSQFTFLSVILIPRMFLYRQN